VLRLDRRARLDALREARGERQALRRDPRRRGRWASARVWRGTPLADFATRVRPTEIGLESAPVGARGQVRPISLGRRRLVASSSARHQNPVRERLRPSDARVYRRRQPSARGLSADPSARGRARDRATPRCSARAAILQQSRARAVAHDAPAPAPPPPRAAAEPHVDARKTSPSLRQLAGARRDLRRSGRRPALRRRRAVRGRAACSPAERRAE